MDALKQLVSLIMYRMETLSEGCFCLPSSGKMRRREERKHKKGGLSFVVEGINQAYYDYDEGKKEKEECILRWNHWKRI